MLNMNLIKPFNYFQWCTERADGNIFNLLLSSGVRFQWKEKKEGKER